MEFDKFESIAKMCDILGLGSLGAISIHKLDKRVHCGTSFS